MAQQDDYDIDMGASPEDIAQGQEAAWQKSVTGGTNVTRNMANIVYGMQGVGNSLGLGTPQMQQARAVKSRLQDILADVDQNSPPDEDPIAKQTRIAHAISTGMIGVSPQVALAASGQAVKLEQARQQQQLLSTNNDERQVTLDKDKLAQRYVVVDTGADPHDKLPSMKQYGDELPMFDNNGTYRGAAFQQDWQQAIQDAKKQGAINPTLLSVDQATNGKLAVTTARNEAAIQMNNAKIAAKQAADAATAGTDPDVLRGYAAKLLLGGDARFIPQDARDGTMKTLMSHGLSPMDGPAVQAEVKNMNSAATAAGSRDGRTMFLESSVPKLGDTVLDAMQGLDRTRVPLINQAIIAGKNFVGDPKEKAYAAAIQSYVNEYARVVSGGTGVTSDAARGEAQALLNKADSPEAVKSVLALLKDKELEAFKQAGPAALELITNPQKYPHLQRAAGLLGLDHMDSFGMQQELGKPTPAESQMASASGYDVAVSKADGMPDGKTGNGGKYIARGGNWYLNKDYKGK